jgi:microcystin-dependent protein
MSEPFLGELRLMSFSFAPRGWAMCNGQLLSTGQNMGLFSLLGTTYGGDGQTNFALPDLRARTPIHQGAGHPLGERAGEQAHTLATAAMPAHAHIANGAAANADSATAAGNLAAKSSARYAPPDGNLTTLHPSSLTNVGGGQAHPNMQPFLTLTWCIALQGIFPS